MLWIIERIKYEYYMTSHHILAGRMKEAKQRRDFKSAYFYTDRAINSGLKAVVASKNMGEETMYLREALRHLKGIRRGFLGLLNKEDLAEVVSEQPYIREVRSRFGAPLR